MKVELKVVGGSRSGQSIPITIPQFMIGRASDCHLKPRSELISRYHCTILSEEAYVAVRDLGSKNGVYVNGERVVGERELKNGDKLMIGPLEFEVVLSVALKGEMKPKVSSISEVVARAVEQNSINVATAKQSQAASQPAPAQPAPAPAQPAPAPAQPAPAPAQPAPAPAQPAPAPAQPAPAPAQPAPAPAQPAPAPAQPAPAPAQPAPAPAQPAPAPAQPAPAPAQPAPAPAQPAPAPTPQPAPAPATPVSEKPTGVHDSRPASTAEDDLADWLLGEDDEESSEALTMSMALEDLDLPYTPKEEEQKPEEEKAKAPSGPSSSDAAAQLLKNFFKGG